ncbi:hypothetical protein ACJMK2_017275 [Sinanodonta woodiana]|uniref:LRAT domain-containing protein n=1 Tax=Sinanodonta woodiana TaxID=1069815 RepID=A0ABD3UWD1_SINWO
MFRQEKQANLDDCKRNVRRGSHIALERKKGSYNHHMLVTDVNNDAITVLEYGSRTGVIRLVSALSPKYLGIIQEKQINFDELFRPNASNVFLVYCDIYPKTDEERNAAVQRARSRQGDRLYCLTCNNCEHFVTWALTGKPISMQWINAGAWIRCKVDFLYALVPEVYSFLKLLLQCLSYFKETCLKYFPNGVDFDKRRKLHVYPLLVKLFLFFRILEKLNLWRKKLISTEDMLRELVKISMSYFVNLAIDARVPAPFPIQVIQISGITALVSSALGFIFNKGHMQLTYLLLRIKTLFLQLQRQRGAHRLRI